jgi:hypothetical protein
LISTDKTNTLAFIGWLACVAVFAWVFATVLPPRFPKTEIAIHFPASIEVDGQDVDQLQRAVSAVIYRHQPADRKWWIADWQQDGQTFRMHVKAVEK